MRRSPAANVCGTQAIIFWQHVVAARLLGAPPRFLFVRHRSARRTAAGRRGMSQAGVRPIAFSCPAPDGFN